MTEKDKPTFMGYKTYNWGQAEQDPIVHEIRALINAQGLKIKDIAYASGVGANTISKWIYGDTRRPQFASLCAVVRAMGYDLGVIGADKVIQMPVSKKRARR